MAVIQWIKAATSAAATTVSWPSDRAYGKHAQVEPCRPTAPTPGEDIHVDESPSTTGLKSFSRALWRDNDHVVNLLEPEAILFDQSPISISRRSRIKCDLIRIRVIGQRGLLADTGIRDDCQHLDGVMSVFTINDAKNTVSCYASHWYPTL